MITTYKSIIEDSFTKPKMHKSNSLVAPSSSKSLLSLDGLSYFSKLWSNEPKQSSSKESFFNDPDYNQSLEAIEKEMTQTCQIIV